MCVWTGVSGGLQSRGVPVLGGASNSQLVIFDESKAKSGGTPEPRAEPWVAAPTYRAKENEQKPERWCDVKVGHQHTGLNVYLTDLSLVPSRVCDL